MVTAFVKKAQPLAAPVPDLNIAAIEEMPRVSYRATAAELDIHKRQFEADAAAIVAALYASLPGGTLDQILRLLLERKASQLVVTF